MQTARDLLEADEVKSAAQEDMKEMLQAAGESFPMTKLALQDVKSIILKSIGSRNLEPADQSSSVG